MLPAFMLKRTVLSSYPQALLYVFVLLPVSVFVQLSPSTAVSVFVQLSQALPVSVFVQLSPGTA